MKTKIKIATTLFSTILTIGSANAQGINIPDGSFEGLASTTLSSPTGIFSGTHTNTATIGAWSVYAAGTSLLGSTIAMGTSSLLGGSSPADGTNMLKLTLPLLSLGSAVGISQTLSQTFAPNSNYTLSLGIDQGILVNLLSQSSLSLMAGNTVIASLSGSSLAPLIDSTPGFQIITLNYQTGSTAPTGNIGIAFDSSSLSTVSGNLYLDNIKLSVAAVPEPGELPLAVGFGLLIVGIRRNHIFPNTK